MVYTETMECREFQKYIAPIVEHSVPTEKMEELAEHARFCKDCRDELEINYVLQYGLKDEDSQSLNIIGNLENDLKMMERMAFHHRMYKSFYILIQLVAAVAVIGSMIYCCFKIWF